MVDFDVEDLSITQENIVLYLSRDLSAENNVDNIRRKKSKLIFL